MLTLKFIPIQLPARYLCRALAAAVVAVALAAPLGADDHLATSAAAVGSAAAAPEAVPEPKPRADLSGRRRYGVASYYAWQFAGKTMANGAPMDPDGNTAASRTLPLGTTAKVTNLETGQSAVVHIADRGPYVKGRIVDLTPATARRIGITPRKGIAAVAVAPITVPLPDGRIKLGAAARARGSAQVRHRAGADSLSSVADSGICRGTDCG